MSTRIDLLTALDELDASLEAAFAENAQANIARSRERCRRSVDELLECLKHSRWYDSIWATHVQLVNAPYRGDGSAHDSTHSCRDQKCYEGYDKTDLTWDIRDSHLPEHFHYVERHNFVSYSLGGGHEKCESERCEHVLCDMERLNATVADERANEGIPLF